MGIQGFVKIRENSWLAEQGFWGEAPKPPKPLFALPLFGSGFASLGIAWNLPPTGWRPPTGAIAGDNCAEHPPPRKWGRPIRAGPSAAKAARRFAKKPS